MSKDANRLLLDAPALQGAHVGITVVDARGEKRIYDHQGDKYFVPASNVKIATCYAGLKYLGDSLVGLRWDTTSSYNQEEGVRRLKLDIEPTGDPTFLHPDFPFQPVFDFLVNTNREINTVRSFHLSKPHGRGWTIDDAMESYMPERSAFPMYGNVVHFIGHLSDATVIPYYFVRKKLAYVHQNTLLQKDSKAFREANENKFHFIANLPIRYEKKIPFLTGRNFITDLLEDTLGKAVGISSSLKGFKPGEYMGEPGSPKSYPLRNPKIIYSYPTDSLLKPMMHRSDNFFAEQTLLMASNEKLGYMHDEAIIDTLLKTHLADLPQKPRWVDGSGLSRYNAFTPQSMVALLKKLHGEFGWARIQEIFPHGGEGTLSGYYTADTPYLWAKTGTLSGVVALSGYLQTKKSKLLYFSVLVNGHTGGATQVRRSVERWLLAVRKKW